jgi:GntR family transcriptional regulator
MPDKTSKEKNSQLRHTDIQAELSRELEAGLYPVGGSFPREGEVQHRFGVGRHTAREALKTLTDLGYIGRRPKSGTIVLATRPSERFIQSIGTIENLIDFGVRTELQVHSFGFARLHNASFCRLLGVPLDQRWLRISGVRRHGEAATPLCWSEYYLPPAYAFDRIFLDELEGPIFANVLKLHGLQLDHVDQEIGAARLNTASSRLLNAPAESPALTQVRRYFERGGNLLQATINIYPAGRYVVRSRIERQE